MSTTETPKPAVPRHVAVIMDGNGRWAAKRKLGRARGHRAGIKAVRSLVAEALSVGVRHLTLFAFSSENWGRPKAEVRALMGMLATQLRREAADLASRGVRIRVIGDRSLLPEAARKAVEDAEAQTRACTRMDLVLAISYGGRQELLDAVRRLVADGVAPEDVTEETLRERLYAPDLPDPDLLIRTSGECRISNFLLWQLAYTELVFTETLWPDFGPEDFHGALAAYAGRKRRFGLTDEQVAAEET